MRRGSIPLEESDAEETVGKGLLKMFDDDDETENDNDSVNTDMIEMGGTLGVPMRSNEGLEGPEALAGTH